MPPALGGFLFIVTLCVLFAVLVSEVADRAEGTATRKMSLRRLQIAVVCVMVISLLGRCAEAAHG